MDKDHKPDRNWIIIAIATLDPGHEIFAKSYKPAVRPGLAQGPRILVNNEDGFFTDLPLLSSARDLKVKQLSCLSKEERLVSRLAKEKEKIEKAKQRIEQLASQAEEVKEGARRADARFDLRQENEQLREEYEKKCRAVEELREFHTQGQEFLNSEGYRAYLEFDAVRSSEQWNAFLQWQQHQQHSQSHSLSRSHMAQDDEEEEGRMEGTEQQQIEFAFQAEPLRASSLAPRTQLIAAWNPSKPVFSEFRGNIIKDRDSFGSDQD